MRQLVIDTETTGLKALAGDRLVEIACVELYQRRLTGKTLHFYLNPERESHPAAFAVHGLTTEFLSDKPKFTDIAEEFCKFVHGAEIIIHNAPFDVGFLDSELTRLGSEPFASYCASIIDTLAEARVHFPGKRHSLDALCDRFDICRKHRTLHGALLDAELLAQVYLAMTRGQTSFVMENRAPETVQTAQSKGNPEIVADPTTELPLQNTNALRTHFATPEEEEEDARLCAALGRA